MSISIDEWRDAIKPSAMLYPLDSQLDPVFVFAPGITASYIVNQERIATLQSVFRRHRWPSRG